MVLPTDFIVVPDQLHVGARLAGTKIGTVPNQLFIPAVQLVDATGTIDTGTLSATIAKLQEILNSVDGLEGFTDGIETLITASNVLLTSIGSNTDGIEGFVDGIEGLITATNGLLTTIRDNTDQLEGFTDGLETLITATNTAIAATNTALSTTNTQLTAINANTDGLETLIGTTNTQLTAINTSTDGIETLVSATNTLITSTNSTLNAIGTVLTSIDAGIPVALGAVNSSQSMPVVEALDARMIKVTAASTTSTLGISATYTSSVINATGYQAVYVTIKSSHNSAVNGAAVIWYLDSGGVTSIKFDVFQYMIGSTVGDSFRVPVSGTYFRVAYTNGTVAQTQFALDTYMSTAAQPASAQSNYNPPNATLIGLNVNASLVTRLTEVRNRTYVKKFITAATLGANTNIHTTTSGKIFYMTGLSISALNTDTNNGGFCLQNGTSTTDRITFVMPQTLVLGQTADINVFENFAHNPVPFATDVRAITLTGVIVASITVFGYEE